MTFSELGSAFREARIAQGISLEDVAGKLKLTVRMVEALENGDIESLPHAVYTRGFIRVYAGIVHIDLAPYQSIIDEQYPRDAHDEYEQKITLVPAVRKRSRTKRLLLLAFFLVCGLLFGAYWQYSKKDEVISQAIPLTQTTPSESTQARPKAQTPEKQQSVAQVKTPNANIQNHAVTAEETATAEKTVAVSPVTQEKESFENKTLANTAEQEDTLEHDEASPEVMSAEQTADITSQTKPVSGERTEETPVYASQTTPSETHVIDITDTEQDVNAPYEMVMIAVEDCWLRVQTDKNKSTQFVLKKGQSFTRRFHNRLEARFGNAGGIRLRYNGQDMPAPGNAGEVANIVYPPEN